MGRIIAIDYGKVRCGIAVTDPLQMIATPLDTVENKNLFSFLLDYFKREEVDKIVVGEAKGLKLENTNSTLFIEDFIKKLKLTFPKKEVVTIDERFTSKMASQSILMSGTKKEKRKDKALIDKVSAAIILQTFLDQSSFFK